MRIRMVVLVAAVAVALAGCGGEAAPPAAPDTPAVPVGADGAPLTSYCGLISPQEITEVTGLAATAPEAPPLTSPTTCKYGPNLQVVVIADASVGAAEASYGSLLETPAFANIIKKGPIGGVDESVYAIGTDASALGLRRQKLVVTITLPGAPEQAEIKLIQLAGRLLSRVANVGT